MSALPDSVRWYATLLVLTWAYAPLARLLGGRFPGRGAFLAKPIGLLATVWPIWFLASITPLPYTTALLWCTAGVAALVGWGLLWRRRAIERDWLLHLVAAEVIALVAFTGLVVMRGYTPSISTTEKPMDMALLSASARATEMPPADPWMAGESINYYYLGYLLHGSLARMSAVPTWVGFNLALASTFAMTVVAAFGLGYDLVRSRFTARLGLAAGALAAFLIAVAGNMHAPVEFLRSPSGVWHAFWWQSIGWQSSRVVVDHGFSNGDTINEFPSFSFILGDLHPHVMALPYTIVSLAVALGLLGAGGWRLRARDEDEAAPSPALRATPPPTLGAGGAVGVGAFVSPAPNSLIPNPQSLVPLVLAGAVIGALYPLNSWDYPTYLAAAALAIFFALGWTRETFIRVGVLGVASIVAWAPFWVTFVPFAGGGEESTSGLKNVPVLGRIADTIAGYSGERTSAGEFLTIFGLPWVVAVLILAVELIRSTREHELRIPKPAVAAVVVLALLALAWPAPVLLLAGLPFTVAIWLIQRREVGDRERLIIATLLAAGFGLILLTEFVYIQDVFHSRLNTLFKVYYQVWTLFGVATAIALIRFWRFTTSRIGLQSALAAGIAVAVLAGLVYPIVSEKTWMEWQGPRAWHGLNGAAFINKIAPDDLAAIEWLADNAARNDVVLEMPGCSYQVNGGMPTSRVAAFTGIPTVIGWTGHEGQWRGGQADLLRAIDTRADDVNTMFANPQDTALLDKYDVSLLFVGRFEIDGTNDSLCDNGAYPETARPGYPGPGWTQIYANDSVRIYRRTTA